MQITQRQDNMIVLAVDAEETITIKDTQGKTVTIFFPEASIFSCYRRSNNKPLLMKIE